MKETDLNRLFRNKKWVIENGFDKLRCERCGNCCPAADCGYFTRSEGVASCSDHENNHLRVGCHRPPLFHFLAGIACRAIVQKLKEMDLFVPRETVTNSLGQVVYKDSKYFQTYG